MVNAVWFLPERCQDGIGNRGAESIAKDEARGVLGILPALQGGLEVLILQQPTAQARFSEDGGAAILRPLRRRDGRAA